MVVVFLERQENLSKENTTSSSNGEQNQNISHLLLGLLRLWGLDFDYEKQGITMDPPQIVPKSKGIEVLAIETYGLLCSGSLP